MGRADPQLPRGLPDLLRERGLGPDADRPAWRRLDADAEVVATASFRELYRRSAWVGHELRRQGVGPGSRVVLLTDTRLEFWYALFGTLLNGALPVAVYPPLDPRRLDASLAQLRRVSDELEPAAWVTIQPLYGVARQARKQRSQAVLVLESVGEADAGDLPAIGRDPGDDPVLLQYTSGSMGSPRAVELSTPAIYANLCASGDAFGVVDGDAGLSWLPLYHDMGLHTVFFSLIFGMSALLLSPLEFLRRPSCWLKAISRYHVTHCPAPNFGYSFATRRIRDVDLDGVDLRSWRVAMCGAEPIDSGVLRAFAERFAPFGFDARALMPAYGLAENVVAVSFSPLSRGLRTDRVDADALEREGEVHPATGGRTLDVVSVGNPIHGHQVRIVSEAGIELPDGRVGEIHVRGASRMRGYRADLEATRAAFEGDWLCTGDLGYTRDEELYVTGRRKELIIRAGRNHSPHDIENAATVPGVAAGGVVAFGRRDAVSGTEEVVLVAEVRKGAAERGDLAERIRSAVRREIGISLHDVRLVERGVVPKTTSGKLRRAECRALYERGALTAPARTRWPRLLHIGAYGLLPARLQRLLERL